jgi:hypothetical protein
MVIAKQLKRILKLHLHLKNSIDDMKLKIAFLSLILISSCRSFSNEWSCRKLDSKVGCASISKADEAYLENKETTNPDNKPVAIVHNFQSSSFEEVNLGQTRLVRIPEKIARLWVAPFTDINGNYHEGSFIRVVEEPAKWQRVEGDENKINEISDVKVVDINKEDNAILTTKTIAK